MNKAIALSVLATATFAGIASAQVTNGSFETGDFTGWSQFGDTSATFVYDSGAVGVTGQDGVYSGFFGSIFGVGGISQVVSVNAGDSVTLSFWLANLGGTPNSFSVSFDGNTLMSFSNGPGMGYTHYSFDVTVGASNPTLSFSFYDEPSYILLDNVTVTPAPGAAAALGLAGIGAARRRRR
ncbi:MAG: hypothetical protein QM783_17240 [Phycisphaerales bacterium]